MPSILADHLLIERGWLARRPGDNRRTYRLRLTRAGRKLLNKVIPLAVELADHTLSGISPAQLRQMHTNLESIESKLRGFTPLEKPE